MDSLSETFEERLQEIDAYLSLLDVLEQQAHDGAPRIGTGAITVQQQRILYSAVYLHLYNLVEATVTWCVEAVCAAAAKNGRWFPADLTDELRREWIRAIARTHVDLNPENRLQATIDICTHLITSMPVLRWKFDRRGGGSWDDIQIEEMTERLGCQVRLSAEVRKGIKRKVRDEKNSLELIRDLRNRLAHGSLSFTECGEGATVSNLRQIKELTANYLREVVASFQGYIDGFEFLVPARRPVAEASP